jgi:hypothetical protein
MNTALGTTPLRTSRTLTSEIIWFPVLWRHDFRLSTYLIETKPTPTQIAYYGATYRSPYERNDVLDSM